MGKRQLERPRRRWEGNIKIYFQVVQWRRMDWIDLAEDRDVWWHVVNEVMNFQVL